jgi:glycosyltransferase involved in cell wall biosynthesis
VRIAFYAPRASYVGGGFSGDLVYVRSLLRGLARRGHELRVVSRLDVRGASPWRLVTEALSIRRLTKRFAPDVWLVYGATTKHPDLFGWWQRPRRYILLSAGLGNASRVPARWRHLFRFAHARSLARGNRVVTYRPKSHEDLKAAGVPEEKLGLLPPAIEPWGNVPGQEDARRRLGLPLTSPVVLCVSRLPAPKKDGRPWKTELAVQVVNAFRAAPSDALLVLVGDGPGRGRVEARAAALGLAGRVRLAGEIPNEKLGTYYAACDIFALPDLLDRPWLSVLEAQSCGRAVVTTDSRASRVTVEAGRTGLLARDLEDFAARIGELAEDRERCRRMGEAAREYVARRHSLDVRIDQIEELLDPRGATSP